MNCFIESNGQIKVFSEVEKNNLVHATGVVRIDDISAQPDWTALGSESLANQKSHVKSLPAEIIYDKFSRCGLNYGPAFKLIREVSWSDDEKEISCKLSVEDRPYKSLFSIPPPLFDALLQVSSIASTIDESESPKIPFAIDNIWIRQDIVHECLWKADWCSGHVSIRSRSEEMVVFDCVLICSNGEVALRAEGVHVRSISILDMKNSLDHSDSSLTELTSVWKSSAKPDISIDVRLSPLYKD